MKSRDRRNKGFLNGYSSQHRPGTSPTFAEAHVDALVGYAVDVKEHVHGTARLGGIVVVEPERHGLNTPEYPRAKYTNRLLVQMDVCSTFITASMTSRHDGRSL